MGPGGLKRAHALHALTRTPVLFAALVAALLFLPVAAYGDGTDVILDYEDNGQIDGCYTLSEYAEASQAIGDDPQYGELGDVINDAKLTNVAEAEGAQCAEGITSVAPGRPVAEAGGNSGTSILLIVGAIALIVGLGVGALVRTRSSKGATS